MSDMVPVRPLLRDVWEGAVRQPLRTALMASTVTLAWAILGTMVAVHQGFEAYIQQLVAELGAHGAMLKAKPDCPMDRSLVQAMAAAAPFAEWSAIGAAEEVVLPEFPDVVVGRADPGWIRMRRWAVREGRSFDEADCQLAAEVALASEAASARYGWHVGERIRTAEGRLLRVVGILGSDLPVPAELADWHPSRPWLLVPAYEVASSSERSVDLVMLRCGDAAGLRRAMELADHVRGADLAGQDARWITAESVAATARVWQRRLLRASAALALAGIWLGGVALLSLLLHDVRTRVSEIGLRRALGATPSDIALLFTAEAVALVLPASALGLGLAAAIVSYLRAWAALPWRLGISDSLRLWIAAAGFSLAVSWWPARRAARLPPAEALRND